MRTIPFLLVMAAMLGGMSYTTDEESGAEPAANMPPGNTPLPHTPDANTPPGNTPPANMSPGSTPSTDVPDQIAGAWQSNPIDFALWENYSEGYYAGRNAVPSREAMVFSKNGDAKFYRYEFTLNLYEELIDCAGTVTFNGDGTFTFYPVNGRKRFYDARNPSRNVDRALTTAELSDPKVAGNRAYSYVASSDPPTLRITVPGSASYNWYKK